MTCPDSKHILSLPFIHHLRPSTLLGYLVSCAPASLPSPFDAPSTTIQSYIDLLTSIHSIANTNTNNKQHHHHHHYHIDSVRSLYCYNSSDNNIVSTSSINATTTTTTSIIITGKAINWNVIKNEKDAWTLIQLSLDTFFQRLNVASGIIIL